LESAFDNPGGLLEADQIGLKWIKGIDHGGNNVLVAGREP
jgi:hypothetical protein